MEIAMGKGMASRSNRPFIILVLGLIAGILGFGDRLFSTPEPIDLSVFLPCPLEEALVWLSRILFIPLMLFFIISAWFGNNLHNRHY